MTRVFDCHDEAYYEWRDAGIRDATLVHVDAHHDSAPAVDGGLVHVGNFVRAAWRDGIVSRVFWVVPDPLWGDPVQRTAALARLNDAWPDHQVRVCSIGDLPRLDTAVLLDVDIDYLITGRVSDDPATAILNAPWIAVRTLGRALDARCPARLATTVATSVTGGYTPLRWKSLGAQIAAYLDERPVDPATIEVAREFANAESCVARGDMAHARRAFRTVVSADPEYRHPFGTLGHHRRIERRFAEAGQLFETALALDPDDHWATLGLAMIALEHGCAETALARLSPPAGTDTVDGQRTRARALAALTRTHDAIAAYRSALKSSLAGAVPLDVWTSNRDRRLVDPHHWRDHDALADLYASAGDSAAERAHRRIATRARTATRRNRCPSN